MIGHINCCLVRGKIALMYWVFPYVSGCLAWGWGVITYFLKCFNLPHIEHIIATDKHTTMSLALNNTFHDTRYYSDFAVSSTQPVGIPCSIITFLASLQEWKVDVLPITWQAAESALGSGATSRVNEAPQTVHRSFACKQLSVKHKALCTSDNSLRMMLNEIAILSHPSVRKHPNIIELEGVCWDVESESRVWPALVFDKARWGDLANFVNSTEWETLSANSRMSLCSDIGQALFFMHDQSKSDHSQE